MVHQFADWLNEFDNPSIMILFEIAKNLPKRFQSNILRVSPIETIMSDLA